MAILESERAALRALVIAGAAILAVGNVQAEESIVGNWKTATGETAAIRPCSEGYCVILKTGKFAGQQIGSLSGSGGNYKGLLTDLEANKTYDGSGQVSGNALTMQGCVMRIFCKSQTWTRP